MQSEQQQRIMGYFIEEAKDHLNTIEQGLLSLQSTMEDTEMVNEIFRAAHSVKGGAAMLGLNSIQKTAHRLEDCFKVLKESPVKADHYLESLFLRVFDTLQALLEQLQGSFSLTDEATRDIMLDAEPVFEELHTHLGELVKQAEKSNLVTVEAPTVALAKSQLNDDKKMLPITFKRTVLVELREMLQLFKQQDSPEHRQALQEHCERLRQLGEEWDLPGWGELLETARAAISFEPNSYRQLAGLVIKEIKQAQELVVTGRSVEITSSEKLKSLVSTHPAIKSVTGSGTQEQEILLTSDPHFTTESISTELSEDNSNAALISSATDWFDSSDSHSQEDVRQEWNEQSVPQDRLKTEDLRLDTEPDSFDEPISTPPSRSATNDIQLSFANAVSQSGESNEPEVGMAELNSLADIFEGQTPDLDQTWQAEEIISLDDKPSARDSENLNLFSLDDQSNFLDLVGDMDGFETPATDQSTSDDLMDWLDDDSTEEVAAPSQESIDSLFSDFDFETTSNTTDSADFSSSFAAGHASVQGYSALPNLETSDLSDLLFETDSSDQSATTAPNTDDLNNLFGDSFFEENTSLEENSLDFGLEADLFALPAVNELNNVDVPAIEEATLKSSLPLSPDTSNLSVESYDYLNETFTEDGSDSLVFEDSFVLELEDLGSNESQADEAIPVKSELDFANPLERFDSDSPVSASRQSSTPQDDEAFIEELVIDDKTDDFDFDEFGFDELVSAQASTNFVVSEDLAGNEAPGDRVEAVTEQLEHILPDQNTYAEGADSLFNWDEPELAVEDTGLAVQDAYYDLDLDLDTTSTISLDLEEKSSGGIDDLFENDPFSTDEAQDLASFESLEPLDNLFGSQTVDTEAQTVEDLNLEALEEPETIPDVDTFNDFFNTDSETTDTSAVDSPLDFDDFPLFEMPAAIDNLEDTALASPPGSDLEALLGEETPVEIDTLDLSSFEPYTLNFEQDLLVSEASSAWDSEAQGEITGEEPAASFDFEGEETLLTNPPESDLETLLGDETQVEIAALEVSQENLFETERDSDGNQHSVGEEAADSLLTWEDVKAGDATANLGDFLGTEAEAVTHDRDWDEFLNGEQGSDIPNVDIAALSEDWNIETEEDETAAALELDWETTDSDRAAAPVEDDFSFLSAPEDNHAPTAEWDSLDELEDLGSMLTEATTLDIGDLGNFENELVSVQPLEYDNSISQQLSSPEEQSLVAPEELLYLSPQLPEFEELEVMLGEQTVSTAAVGSADIEGFEDLEALLGEQMPAAVNQSLAPMKSGALEADTIADDEFGDLEILLEQAEKTMGGPPTASAEQRQPRPLSRQRPRIFEQTMRVPVKHLDSLSNLVGELVVNRNSLEQDQEQLRQFLDNLSHQVLALSDVGSRMQDLYERTLLESSLLASRYTNRSLSLLNSDSLEENNASGVEYDPLEMDRFTGFHLLSQEMIELIVRVRESASDIELLVDGTDQVARMLRQVTTQLQEGLTRSRMVPFAQTADRLPRAVREISIKLRKQAELHVEGRETLIDKMILEHLYDPLTHLVNNAITHGIESPEVRKAAGKPPIGRITLRAFHQGNQTVISISDDGAGINPEQVRQKAVEKRLITLDDAQSLTNLDLYDFLFRPGFTTKDKADDFSGRGVGMDVVRTSLSEIRGVVHIDSTLGKGTTFTIRLPLTLSICKALCCLSDRARIAFPMDGVEDMLDLPSERVVTNSEGQTCIQWRDMLLPFQSLSELLTYKRQLSRNTVYGGKREDDIISIVVLRSAGNFLAIQVDQVLGEQEIVIKQLEGPPPKPVGIAGATVLGDGRIMPIADVLELIDLAQGRIRKDSVTIWLREEPHDQVPEELPATKPEPLVLIVDDSITVRELLSMTFTKAGYRVEQARDGQEAWDKLRSGLPCDIVFCDIEMPRMDGLELLSRLQKDENLDSLPIAMLTSRGADRHRQMASQLGASGYFTKPYLEEVLLDAAQRMIKGERLF